MPLENLAQKVIEMRAEQIKFYNLPKGLQKEYQEKKVRELEKEVDEIFDI